MHVVRRLSLVLGLVACMATGAAAASPVSVSLFPPLQIVPPDKPVSGLRINLIYGRNTDVTGLDWGLVNHATGNESAWQVGGGNYVEKDFTGWQDSFVNATRGKFTGLQSGWFNQCGDGNGVGVGFINVA